jgi:hypothetical protein
MTEHEASRTLVKSTPELWAECSDADTLARHLNGSFGEIRITRLEPETAVAWEGEHASGTVRLEPSGWGTRVVLTAQARADEAVAAAASIPGGLEPVPEPAPADRGRLLHRLRRLFASQPLPARGQAHAAEPPPGEPAAAPVDASAGAGGALAAALDSLGQAHHRPYSRT